MDFYELLTEDHRLVQKLLQDLEKSNPGSNKSQELFLELTREVQLHSYVEELLVYPLLQEYDDTRDLSLEGVEEHRVVKMLFDEMKDITLTHDQWTAKFAVLKEQIESHIREEEQQLFPAARRVLTAEQAESLGGRIITEKALRRAPEPITE